MPTTTINLTIDNSVLPEAVDALCKYGKYQATLDDGAPNPTTKAQFAKKVIAKFVRNVVAEQRRRDLLATDTEVSEALIS